MDMEREIKINKEEKKKEKKHGDVEKVKRPCKIWASYGGRCIEKILAPK